MNEKGKTLIIATVISIIAFSLLLYPKDCLEASIGGLDTWWRVVFPSLLPFFILSELLISFGVVSFLGVLFEPFMGPFFHVSGVGGFVWAMGMATGLPTGAKLTATLRKNNQLTRIEAERLVSFTNSSNPLFIFGAISVGFFHNAALGILLAVSHYLSNACVGFLMRFYGASSPVQQKSSFSLATAFRKLHQTRMKETRSFGKILGDAIHSSIQTLLVIGGFIILFSVVNRMLISMGVINFTDFFHLPKDIFSALLGGLFEITLGTQLTSQLSHLSLLQRAIFTSMILGFGGLSVHAQVASILAETDIRYKPYFVARVIQAVLAGGITFLLWKPLYANASGALPTFLSVNPTPVTHDFRPLITLSALYVYVALLFRKLEK